MKRVLQIQAYAKLNLVLRVVGRREDGYHLIQSLITAVDLADEITLTVVGQGVTLDALAELGPPERNLAVRAARALLDRDKPGVRITLRKRVPVGAGLGGGSSDAAAVLAGLNQLLALGKTEEELQGIGAALGADVSFFLGRSPAWVEGVGDRVTPIEATLPGVFLILAPSFRCPTPDVYRAFDGLGLPLSPPGDLFTAETQRAPRRISDGWPATCDGNSVTHHPTPITHHGFSADSASLRWNLATADVVYENDLWPAAVHLCPQLASLRAMLAEVSPFGVGMTGSGSALFAAFPCRADAEEAREQLAPRVGGELFVAAPIRWGYRIRG